MIKKIVLYLTGNLESMEENDRYVQGSVWKEVKEKYQRRCVNIITVYFHLHILFGYELD